MGKIIKPVLLPSTEYLDYWRFSYDLCNQYKW